MKMSLDDAVAFRKALEPQTMNMLGNHPVSPADDKSEPNFVRDLALSSIAISLKRIADAMRHQTPPASYDENGNLMVPGRIYKVPE